MNVVDTHEPAKATVSYAEQVAAQRAIAASGNLDTSLTRLGQLCTRQHSRRSHSITHLC